MAIIKFSDALFEIMEVEKFMRDNGFTFEEMMREYANERRYKIYRHDIPTDNTVITFVCERTPDQDIKLKEVQILS